MTDTIPTCKACACIKVCSAWHVPEESPPPSFQVGLAMGISSSSWDMYAQEDVVAKGLAAFCPHYHCHGPNTRHYNTQRNSIE